MITTYIKEEDINGIKKYKTYANVSQLKNWEDNPREIKTELFDFLVASLHDEGQLMPMLVDVREGHEGEILGGNMTFRAWTQRLNRNEVWIEPVLPTDDNHAISLALKHNANYGNYIEIKLQEMAQKLKDAGYAINEIPVPAVPEINLEELLQRVSPNVTEDEAPELSSDEAISKLGEVYQLGNHRLMCGDATNSENITKLLNGQTANVLITDPPYGVDYSGKNEFLNEFDKGKRNQVEIQNDNIEDYEKFFTDFLINLKGSFDNTFYIFMSGLQLHNLRKAIDNCQYKCSDYLIWAKNNHVLGRKDYNSQHEFIVYGWQNTHKFFGGFATTIINFDRPQSSELHPTMKPIGLLAKLINDSTLENNIVLDLFGGSGSTLIACEQTNRICYMSEIDPKYCDVIRKRYAKLKGEEEQWQMLTPQIQ